MIGPLEIERFLIESLRIEGVTREPTFQERDATCAFLEDGELDIDRLNALQSVYTPRKPLRLKAGMDVTVGGHLPPRGGPAIGYALESLIERIRRPDPNPWACHIEFELLHPYLDGNGRTGRALWAWHMIQVGEYPFNLSFLHCWYYQTLSNARVEDVA